MAIEWRQGYEIGVEEIDKQHKELFAQINKLLDACSKNMGKEEVVNTMSFLGNYVITHFSAEEKLQKDHSYPEYKAHKAIHDQFVKDFGELKEKLEEEGLTLRFVTTVNKVVVDWLVKHIASADRALGTFLKSKG